MDSAYKIVMILHKANLQEAGKVEAALYELIDKNPDLEIERFSPMRTREPTDGKS